ncbi:ABC transporter permease [Pseudothermotoga thermarum]|uniref:Binding-protein-dependent transport systems inner membrane component n=1 Tax=Pseudothermotoga thermarum DSM 5069 TaxID=688269 RepID=F7YTT7_9THEM|nr:ABC transporter permease [Pseudothermotoga thermarum]AEH51382.1 binding-protein-dependent transport systems inner membrane component [Pseudothermotoga thermarum DSM 5069]
MEKNVKTVQISYWKDVWRRLKKKKPAMFGLVVIIIFTLMAIFAPLIAPADPNKIDLDNRLKPPGSPSRICKNGIYILGSDEFGRDIFSRIIYGSRISLSIGILTQAIVTVIGIAMGAIAGYYGGKIDMIIMRVVDILFAFPDLLFYIGIMFALGPGIYNLFIAISVLGWASRARLIRSQVLAIKETEYIEAAKAQGLSDFRIIVKHILPNCIGVIIVSVTLGIPSAILTEASLSFLGLGILPPTPSWGNMIYAARPYLRVNPLYSVWPGIAIMLSVFAFNLLGDGLRDVLDPRMRQ